MRDIPKDILNRCTFQKRGRHDDVNQRIVAIIPEHDCECGEPLINTRTTRIAKNKDPVPHWRELCMTCHRVRLCGTESWYGVAELNAKIRRLVKSEDK